MLSLFSATLNMTPTPLPYAGLRVLDISQGIAGPYCAHILWQQGAHVLKVEPPAGDWIRFVGVAKGDLSALAIQFNAGKLSVVILRHQVDSTLLKLL